MKLILIAALLAFFAPLGLQAQTGQPSTSLAPTTWAIRDPVTNNWKLVTAEKSPGAPTAALAGAGAGSVDNGTHQYRVELVTAVGHTNGGTVSSTVTVVDKTVNGKVSLTSIPTGSVFVTSRKIYRTAAGAGAFLLLTTIADNTTTTFTDNVADSSLTTAMPTNNSTANPVLTYTGSTGAVSIAGAAAGTVTSVSASGGTETTTGSAITTTGTIRGAQTVRNSSGLTVTVLDSDRGKVLKVTNAGGPDIVIAQAGTAGAFAAGWYCDILVTGAGGAILASTVSTIDGAANFAFSQNQTVRVVSDGTNYVTTLRGGGLTGSGTTNTLAKFTGAGVVGDSQITDDGTIVNVSPAISVRGDQAIAGISVGVNAPHQVDLGDYLTNQNGTKLSIDDDNKRITQSVGVDSSVIDGTAHTVATTAAASIANTAPVQTNTASTGFSVVSPLFGAGSDGTKFQIDGSGAISKYRNEAVDSGELLIGDGGSAIFKKTTLNSGTGISITNGAGSITIAQDNTGLGTILPVDMSNGVLSTATGAVYSSPGTTAGLTTGTEGSVSFPVPRGGTIRNLYVRTGTSAKVNTPTTVITIRKNAVDTAVTVTMTQTTSTTTADTTHSFTVVAGDLITISFLTTGAAAVSTSIAGVSFELD